jgi:hypothetical protein
LKKLYFINLKWTIKIPAYPYPKGKSNKRGLFRNTRLIGGL